MADNDPRSGQPAGPDSGPLIPCPGDPDTLPGLLRAIEARAEARYRSMFENMPAGFARCRMLFEGDDPVDFEYLEVNPAFALLTGLSDVAGRRVSEVIPGIRDSSPELFETYGRVARTGMPEHLDSFVQGLGIWFSLNVYCPAPGEFIALFETITERKQAEMEVRQARARLEAALVEIRTLNASLELRVQERTAELQAANAELESFSYAVSHDLRSPLRAIAGFSQALIEDLGPRLGEAGQHDLDHILKATVRMSDLIDGLLHLSRTTRADLQRQWVDLSAMAARIREELEAGEPGRQVVWDVAEGLQAWGDGQLLEALLRNLLGNAWKFSAQAKQPRIALRGAGRPGQFTVADNGAGFDMAYAAKLFEPFQRLHRQDEYPGLGIGLATAWRVVKRHGGVLQAQARPGAGAEFTFSLPGP
jgi:signal transduction histidine kinase